MTGDNPGRLGAHRARGHHVLLFLEREHLSAHQSSHARPPNGGIGNNNCTNTTGHDHQQQNNDNQIGNAVDNLHDTHHYVIQSTSEVAGNAAVDDTNDKVYANRRKSDNHGHTGAVPDTHKHIAAQRVGTENVHMSIAGIHIKHSGVGMRAVHLGHSVGRNNRNNNRHQNNEHQIDCADQRNFILGKAAHCVFPKAQARAGNRLCGARVISNNFEGIRFNDRFTVFALIFSLELGGLGR